MKTEELNTLLKLHGDNKFEPLFCRFDVTTDWSDIFDSIPKRLNSGGIFICRQGEAEFFLDLKSYKLKKGDLCVAFPFSLLQVISKSDDFSGFGMTANIELFEKIQIPSATDYYIYIKDNPCISLSDEGQEILMRLCDMVIEKYNRIYHPFRMEITYSLFRALYFEIAAIYKKGKPIAQESVPRKDMIVRRFMFLLSRNYLKHRDVDYYANELCITSRYLSSIIKEKTGVSALAWISSMVIKQAKILLKDSKLSVIQVSEELNFANPSFFGQYFKKHTGMTPKKFKDTEYFI